MKIISDIQHIVYPFGDNDTGGDDKGIPKIIVKQDLISFYNLDKTFSTSEVHDIYTAIKESLKLSGYKKKKHA